MGINQKETEVKYQEREKMALENLCLSGEPGIVKGEPKDLEGQKDLPSLFTREVNS